jgi:hypothetical protein
MLTFFGVTELHVKKNVPFYIKVNDPWSLKSRLLAPTWIPYLPFLSGAIHAFSSSLHTLKSYLLNSNFTFPVSPAFNKTLSNPLSNLGGVLEDGGKER